MHENLTNIVPLSGSDNNLIHTPIQEYRIKIRAFTSLLLMLGSVQAIL
jgi:hypothetical protein